MVVFADSLRIPVAQVQHPVFYGHFAVGRNDVNVIRGHPHPVCGLHDRQDGGAGQYLSDFALPGGVQMEHHDISHAQMWR